MSTKNYLFSYILATGGSGTASFTHSAGVDLDSWASTDLNGNGAFMHSTYSTMSGYKDISSIENWDLYGANSLLSHGGIVTEINFEYNSLTQSGTTWSGLTLNEKKILSRYFIVDKSHRDEVHTQFEQNTNDHFILYHYLSIDAEKRLGDYNKSMVPKSIDYKKGLKIRLHPHYEIDKFGWLNRCIYYKDLSISQDQYEFNIYDYSNPVLKYEAEYIMATSSGYVEERTITRSWMLASGTYSTDTKITRKVYEPFTSRDEGRRRRQNLVSKLIVNAVGLIVQTTEGIDNTTDAETDAMEIMKRITPAISEYYEYGAKKDIQGNDCKLIQEITISTYSRFDNWVPDAGSYSIRDYVLDGLDPQ